MSNQLFIIETNLEKPTSFGVSRITFESGGFRLGGEVTISDAKSFITPPQGRFKILPFQIEIELTSVGTENRIKFKCV